tara:strand:- start:148 stop:270 length:123 start_codon:yes stop_codon:yes gene_type:complete
MQKNKTQQFARFFIKDIKIKTSKDENSKSNFDELNLSSTD